MSNHPEIPVVCTVCATRMYAVASQIGKGLQCPDCHTINVVKAPEIKKKPQPVAAAVGDGYRLKEDPAEIVEFTCTSCHDPIKAKGEYAGRKVRCPNCETVNVVPRPKDAVADGVALQVADGVAANPTKKQIADRIMARAREEMAEHEEEFEPPEIPVQPFFEGVANFPFYGNVMVMWVGFGCCMAAMGTLLALSVEMLSSQSFEMGTGLALGLAFGVVFAFTIYVFPAKFSRITESTATGYDKVEFVADDFFDRLMVLFLLFNAIGFGSIPGISLAAIAGVPKGLGFISAFGLFPIFFLSMLEAASPFNFFSERIRNSFSVAPGSWVLFYCVTVPMMIGVFLLFVVMIFSEQIGAAIAVAALPVPIASVIYFRMLGRLALLIGQAENTQSIDGLQTDG